MEGLKEQLVELGHQTEACAFVEEVELLVVFVRLQRSFIGSRLWVAIVGDNWDLFGLFFLFVNIGDYRVSSIIWNLFSSILLQSLSLLVLGDSLNLLPLVLVHESCHIVVSSKNLRIKHVFLIPEDLLASGICAPAYWWRHEVLVRFSSDLLHKGVGHQVLAGNIFAHRVDILEI